MQKRKPIFYSALMLTGVNLLLRFAGTSFQVYISAKIGPAGVGLLQLVMSVGFLAMTAAMAGIRTTTMYLSAEELGHKKPGNILWVLSGCFLYSIVCSGVISLLLYYYAPFLAQNWIGDIRTTGAIRLYASFLPVSCLCGVMSGYFTAANRIGALAAVEVAEQIISIAVTLLLLDIWAGTDPAKACQAIVCGSGIGAVFTLILLIALRFKEHAPRSPAISLRRRILRCAAPLAVADVAKSGISTTENLMVPKRLALYPFSRDSLAAFGLITGMVFPILMFPAAILFGLAELLIPELARCAAAGSHSRIRYLVKRSLRVCLLYGCIICGSLFILAEALCFKLYSNTDAGIWLRRFSFMVPMLYCDAITDAMTKGLGQQQACVRYNIFTSLIDVALLFLLLPKLGLAGYFISFFISHLINFLLSLRRLMKTAQVHLSLRTAVIALLLTVCAVAITIPVRSSPVRCILFIVIWCCLLFLGKVLHREDILWMQNLIRKK